MKIEQVELDYTGMFVDQGRVVCSKVAQFLLNLGMAKGMYDVETVSKDDPYTFALHVKRPRADGLYGWEDDEGYDWDSDHFEITVTTPEGHELFFVTDLYVFVHAALGIRPLDEESFDQVYYLRFTKVD